MRCSKLWWIEASGHNTGRRWVGSTLRAFFAFSLQLIFLAILFVR